MSYFTISIDGQMSHQLQKPPKPNNSLLENGKRNILYVERKVHGLKCADSYVLYNQLHSTLWDHLGIFLPRSTKFVVFSTVLNEQLYSNRIKLTFLMNFNIFSKTNIDEYDGRYAINCVNTIYKCVKKQCKVLS